MTKEQRENLRTLALAATPGEWEKRNWDGEEWPEKRISVASGNTAIVISPRYAAEQAEHDTTYIAAANPTTLLALLDRVDELESAEPVAWMWETPTNRGLTWVRCLPPDCDSHATSRPLYRHPPTERAVPEGWKLVPVEPTFEMLTAADTENVNKNGVMAMTRAYKAMLAAAPGAGGDA